MNDPNLMESMRFSNILPLLLAVRLLRRWWSVCIIKLLFKQVKILKRTYRSSHPKNGHLNIANILSILDIVDHIVCLGCVTKDKTKTTNLFGVQSCCNICLLLQFSNSRLVESSEQER